ncbi:HNH endonuclease [Methylobacterium sp. 10]|uniref:HNH endonuclease n=1 Tax=Methylobacterium sp. 10 TaxID=1101191 RepID=UPI0004818271|nr:HNH endonuclease [Methylobacterium sp. 10]
MLDLQTLVLNADYRPLSYNPLSLWSWKDAFTALFLDRVTLVASYDVEARSPSRALRVPSVVALKNYVTLARSPAFTRYNIYLRDTFSCQYCGLRMPSGGLTFDHVIPRSRGGLSSWENVVAACSPCNLRKANRTPAEAEMPLLHEPHRPTRHELHRRQPEFDHREYHHSWLDYLYWDSELES